MNFAANPIFAYLTGRKVWPDRDTYAWLIAALVLGAVSGGLASLMIHAIAAAFQAEYESTIIGGIFIVLMYGYLFLNSIIPFVFALTAAVIVARNARTEMFQLLLLTPLSTRQIIWGYLGTVVHTLRWVLIPHVAIGFFLIVMIFITSPILAAGAEAAPWRISPAGVLVSAGVMMFNVYVSIWLSTIIGVWLGLTIRQVANASAVALMASLVWALLERGFVQLVAAVLGLIPLFPPPGGPNTADPLMLTYSYVFHTGGLLLSVAILILIRRQFDRRRPVQSV